MHSNGNLLKQSGGKITHPPYVTIKMAATAIVLHSGQKKSLFLFKGECEPRNCEKYCKL